MPPSSVSTTLASSSDVWLLIVCQLNRIKIIDFKDEDNDIFFFLIAEFLHVAKEEEMPI